MSADPRPRLFRQAALDRLSAPEALDSVMNVTGPRSWIALAAIGLLLAGVIVWGIGGRLRVEVTADGEINDAQEAVVFVDARAARQIAVGASALVLPGIYDRSEYGYINGSVTSVGTAIASREAIRAALGDDRLADRLDARGAMIAVRVRLTPAPGNPSGVRWSSSAGPETAMPSGVPCTASVIVAERRPITIVVPALQRVFGS